VQNREWKFDTEKEKKDAEQEKLPGCTQPSDAESSRAWNEDEPCDDGRAG